MMDCKELRSRLVSTDPDAIPNEAGSHLRECPACRSFAERLRGARAYFRGHHTVVEPDAGFAARVASRLNGGPTEALGWAALRLLPATLALVLLLAWFVARTDGGTAYVESEAPTDDLLSWVLERSEEGS